jgi:hypothetical protein
LTYSFPLSFLLFLFFLLLSFSGPSPFLFD